MSILLLGSGEVGAQFSITSVGEKARASRQMPFNVGTIDVDVVNATQALVMRKALWRQQNAVDFKINLTGMVTQFNKPWTDKNQNSVVLELGTYYDHTYSKNRFSFWFKFDAFYGMNYIDDIWFKNQDRLKINNMAKWSVRDRGLLRNWAYSISAEFSSQFSQGFKSRTEKKPWSNFMAPAWLTTGIGLTYTSPNPKLPFVVTFDPISVKALFVMDDRIEPGRRQELGIPVRWIPAPTPEEPDRQLPEYKDYKVEGGSNFNMRFNRTFAFGKNKGLSLQYNTTLDSFYGWITQVARHDPEGDMPEIMPTVNWSNTFTLKPLRFLSFEMQTTMRYDKAQVDKVQMKYYLRVGLEYRFRNR